MIGSLLQSLLAFVVTASIYAWALSRGDEENSVRALVFVAMVTGYIALIFSNRSLGISWQGTWSGGNPVLWWILLDGSTGLVLASVGPVLRELFHFSADTPHMLDVGELSALTVLMLSAGVKPMIRASE